MTRPITIKKEYLLPALVGAWVFITLLNMIFMPRRYAPAVETQILKVERMPLVVRGSGNLEAKDSNTLKMQFEGPVMVKHFREGQQVVQGEVLAIIGREKIRLDNQSKHDALLNARADLDKAKKELILQKQLFKKGAVAHASVDDASRILVKAQQSLAAAEGTYAEQQKLWNSSTVKSPINGTVVKDWIGDDKIVSAGKEIVTVADVSEYTVKARVDELDIKQVRENQVARISLQIYPEKMFSGVVREVGSVPDGSALPQVPVVLRLNNSPGYTFRPKLSAEAKILTGWTTPVISVPLTAVANTDGNPRVWVINGLSRLRLVDVELGRSNPDQVEITKGLSEGQTICVTAEPDFADGMKVVKAAPGTKPANQSRTNALLNRAKISKKPDSKDPKGSKDSKANVVRVPTLFSGSK